MSGEEDPRRQDDAVGVAPSIVVTGGGEPTPEQVAAVVIALTPVAAPDRREEEPDNVPRGWLRAALIEGVGGRPSASLPDLTSGRFGLGHIGDPTTHA